MFQEGSLVGNGLGLVIFAVELEDERLRVDLIETGESDGFSVDKDVDIRLKSISTRIKIDVITLQRRSTGVTTVRRSSTELILNSSRSWYQKQISFPR